MNEIDEDSKKQLDDESRSYRRNKKWALIGLFIVAVIFGLAAVIFPDSPSTNKVVELITGIPLIFLIFSWCYYDACERNLFLTNRMKICLVLLSYIAFLFYAFKSRGIGGVKIIAVSILLIAAWLAVAIASAFACYGISLLFGCQ